MNIKSACGYRSGRGVNEASRRLYRTAGETSQRLEHLLTRAASLSDLFSDEIADLRMRLKDLCERLIFTEPIEYGKKVEDLLWRKVYYEFFQKCKLNKKKILESEVDRHTLRSHLLAAIGAYHHMLIRIQTEFHLDLNGQVDAPFLWHMRGVKKERWKKYQQSASSDSAIQSWAHQACHRFLTYLGDLARYMSEFQSDESETDTVNRHLAERYYLQAFCLNDKNGTPHNQLGSLAQNQFDSAYHYMRCLSSVEKFDRAEGNLIRIFEKNSQILQELKSSQDASSLAHTHSLFLAIFLKLCEIFYFSYHDNLHELCQEGLENFDRCVLEEKNAEPVLSGTKPDSGSSEFLLVNEEVVFKVVVMCMMCVSKLHARESSDISTATAFMLALFSSIAHCASKKVVLQAFQASSRSSRRNDSTDENGSNQSNCSDRKGANENTLKKKSKLRCKDSSVLRKLRRRRKKSSTSQEDSEYSDSELPNLVESDEENGAISDVSQAGSCSSDSQSDREEEEFGSVDQNNVSGKKSLSKESLCNVLSVPDKVENVLRKTNNSVEVILFEDIPKSFSVANLSSDQLLPVLKKLGLLSSLKVFSDWLLTHKNLLIVCAESLKYLLPKVVDLLNLLLNIECQLLKGKDSLKRLKRSGGKWIQTIALPEDILLQNLPALQNVHSNLSFRMDDKRQLSSSDQVFLRIQCLLAFGDMLAEISESLIAFDEKKNQYFLKECSNNNIKPNCISNTKNKKLVNNQKQHFMQEMAHLWLKSEVNNLEMSIEHSGSPQLSPLLVVDTSALCSNLPLLKQLIASKKFIVIVPKNVIDNLDQLKKKSIGAREAIRWLEFIFQKGSRHIRSQRDTEKLSLHPIKYPKRKDKESWDLFQTLECCHFLVQQQSAVRSKMSLVTLLVGPVNELPSNAGILAESLNVSMENLDSFFSKWRNTSKKPG